MMPAYGSMDSQPYYRTQMPYSHYYHPAYEPIHPQMKMDPSKPPMVYEQYWPPHAAGYSYPASGHFCCAHNSFPGYFGFRPPYPHVPSPSPMYYPGHCPAYLDPHSLPCAPPPRYTMEIPRYEYDKYMPKEYPYHCCGCPNHPSHQKEGNKSVKIEEQEPEVEKNINDALVPTRSRNYPYPFLWYQPGCMSNQEQRKPVAADMGGPGSTARDAKHTEDFKAGGQEEPKVWNGWLPFDGNSLSNIILDRDGEISQNLQGENNRKESEDGKRIQNQRSENNSGGFPFPIIWMPYYNMQEEDGRKNNQDTTSTSSNSSPRSIEEPPPNHTYKSFPVNFITGEKAANSTSSEEDSANTGGFNVTEKANEEKSIPVKPIELRQGKDDSESSSRRGRSIPVKQMEDNVEEADKESKTNVKRESLSPRKTLKLPPVCLRVDPIPRKGNGNGSSRSPSPPAAKGRSQTAVGGTSKNSFLSTTCEEAQPDSKRQNGSNACETSKNSCSSTINEKAQPDSKLCVSNASEKVKPKEKIIEVVEMKTRGNKDENQMGDHESSSGASVLKESRTNGDECKIKENKAGRKEEPAVEEKATEGSEAGDLNETDGRCKTKTKVLSDVEAAVLIQAAYRGFQLRKWEPLKKLKQISEVSKKVTEVNECIRALEASSDLQNDDKQQLTIGETIMRLLLKLDTIQGLHPSVREIRKSLARELTSLQEKLDSMMSKKSEQLMQDSSAPKPVENVHWSSQDGKDEHEQQDSQSTNRESYDTLRACEDQISVEDSSSNIMPEEEVSAVGSKESRLPVRPIYDYNVAEPSGQQNGITEGDAVREMIGECNSENTEIENMAVENASKSEVNGTPIEAADVIVPLLEELPRGITREEHVDLDSVENIKAEQVKFEPEQRGGITVVMDDYSPQHGEVSEIDAIQELPVGILDEDPMMARLRQREASEIDAIEELPVGVLDEDPLMAQSEKNEGIEPQPSNEATLELPVGLLDEEEKSFEPEKCEKSETLEEAIAELPLGLLDEDTPFSEFEKREHTETTKEAMAELPVGLLYERTMGSELEKHGETEAPHEVQVAREEGHEGTVPMNASADSISTINQSEQQQQMLQDDQVEVQSTETEESDGWVKVECKRDDKDQDASSEDTELEYHLGESMHGEKEQPSDEPVPSLPEAPENGNMIGEQVNVAVANDRELMARKKDEQDDRGVNNEKKLIEENERLKEMMKKLLDARNEQLNVISDLTGRVKDLEKKLVRKKRLSTKGFKPGTRRPCLKPSKHPLQGRTVGVAM